MPTDDATTANWLKPFNKIRRAIADEVVWGEVLGAPSSGLPSCGIHLAVFVEPFLGYVLDGSKTVESRFSVNRCAPFGKVSKGDVILLKKAGGPVVGIARVQTVWSYQLDDSSWGLIREQFAKMLRVQYPEFWERKRGLLRDADAYRSRAGVGTSRMGEEGPPRLGGRTERREAFTILRCR